MTSTNSAGQWRVEPCSGHNGHKAGFYVARTVDSGTEWMKDEKRRLACFRTEQEAIDAITGGEKMTSTKEQGRHTPRPWHIGMKPGPIIYGPNGEQVADMRGELLWPQEAAGNALLVCAAPVLLQALEEVVSLCEAYKGHPIHNDKRVTDARALIAQAKGES